MFSVSEENSNNQQNPTNVWQTVWAKLFSITFEQMIEKDFIGAWRTTELLITQIPPECETDIQKEVCKVKKVLNTQIESYTTPRLARDTKYFIDHKLPPALLELFSAIKKSLYDRHWINKDFGIHPDSGKRAKIF